MTRDTNPYYDDSLRPTEAVPDGPPEAKPWWQSRTILAALASLACSVAALAGYALDERTVLEATLLISNAVAAILAIQGRVAATRPIRGGLT